MPLICLSFPEITEIIEDLIAMTGKVKTRCPWPGSPLMIKYHDTEWGTPLHDDRKLFEFLILDGMQAGLTWASILQRRENYRAALDNFDAVKIARYDKRRMEKLLINEGIIRNRKKIESIVTNARAFLKVKKEFGTFDRYIWSFVGGKPIINRFETIKGIPAITEESIAMSKDLKKRGFSFVGPTICYAFMQAAGMVNDHVVDCFRHKEVQKRKRRG
ncbi:3-methyl-adenine DNA glycosylase I, constitutive [Candidatus Zixiibacteriota bacterium]|nr:3-methyl-adenine DNA glycosylase I, constitutive [candidate division Zixibacteria bacterium]